jgi:hypothetical protein
VEIGTAPVLALLVGGFHTALFTFLRGRGGAKLIVVFVAAALGAWAGDATGGRLGIDPIRLGDFHLLAASVMAWLGIGFVEALFVMGPGTVTDRGL